MANKPKKRKSRAKRKGKKASSNNKITQQNKTKLDISPEPTQPVVSSNPPDKSSISEVSESEQATTATQLPDTGNTPELEQATVVSKSSNNSKPYYTLFVGVLKQDSALSTGGTQQHSWVDDPLCRDGQGRLILRGTGLAGALIRTARTLYPECELANITGMPKDEQKRKEYKQKDSIGSLWQTHNSHLIADGTNHPKNDVRPGVRIRPDTGAAAKNSLFDVETLPRGTRWTFLLAVPTWTDEGQKAAEIAAACLLEWQRGRCWLGRNVARGMGWLHFTELAAYQLDSSDFPIWPPPSDNTADLKLYIEENFATKKHIHSNFNQVFTITTTPQYYYCEINGTVTAGESDDSYGWDAVSVGSHDSAYMSVNRDENADRYVPWSNFINSEPVKSEFDPDGAIALTADSKPYIPGSALRGPLRHALSRALKAQAKIAASDSAEQPEDDKPPENDKSDKQVEKLFGNLTESAALLVSDAYLTNDNWKLVWLQQHAEDEFAGSTYESAKFDKLAVFQGTFAFKLIIESSSKDEVKAFWQTLQPILGRSEQGHLPIGSQQWRGLGWVKWQLDSPLYYAAGEKPKAANGTTD